MVGSRVYVGGLPYGCRERDLEKFFKGYGRTRDILLKNRYGFIEFDDYRDADDAVYELNGKELRIVVEHARGNARRVGGGGDRYGGGGGRPRRTGGWYKEADYRGSYRYGPPTSTDYRLIVENLSSRVSWQDLKDYMRQAGEVTYADAHKDRRNEGVVEFATHSDMKNALDKLDDTELNGRRIRLIEDRRRSRRSRSSSSRSRSRSRSRRRSRSRSRRSSRSRSRRSSRSKSRAKSASRSKSRSKSKDKKSRSRSRSKSNAGERDREREEKSRSRSADVKRDRDDSMDDFMDVREITQNALLNLIQIWSTMYDPSSEELPSRRRRFVELLREYLKTLIDEEAELSENLRNQIIQKIQEFDELQTALEIPQSKRKNWAVKYPYKDILKQIEGDMKAYKEMRDERLEKLRSLKNKEMELCKFLELSPVPDFPNPIPSESQMDEVELHIFHLREELNKRANNTFNESKTRIINLISELEYEVHDDFGNEILSKNSSEFQITTSNMVKLREFVQSLENKYEEKLGYRECLLDKLKKLWDRIKVNEVEREKFLSCYPSIKKSHINALRNEIERCEEIKLAMLKPIIESVREELQQIWDLLALSSEERLKFKAFTTDHVSEDILDLHEFELEELKAFYEKYKPLYELIEKRKALWERMRHLDLLAADKTRLFSNRGGQLLKEEKERKSLEVNVPKIDKQLKEALEEFEKEEGRPFLYHGSNLLEEVIRAWDERLTAKENSKPGKNVVKKPGVVAEKGFTPSFPLAKRKLGTPLTNLSTPKSSRKFEETMIIEVPWAIGKLPVIPVVSSCNANISASSTNASYSHFQDGLETPISALKQRDHSSPSKSPHLRL